MERINYTGLKVARYWRNTGYLGCLNDWFYISLFMVTVCVQYRLKLYSNKD